MPIRILEVHPDVQRHRRALRLRAMFPARCFQLIRDWPRWDKLPSLRIA